MDSAYAQTGGLGRFQLMALFILAVMRNMGQPTIYGSAIATTTPAGGYLCRFSSNESFYTCSLDDVCDMKDDRDFEYKPNDQHPDFYENWFTQLHLECTPVKSYAILGSMYFTGYFTGIVLFFLPDMMGRKGTLMTVLPFLITASAASIYSPNLKVKAIGNFIQGFLHIKVSCSFQYMYELVPRQHKVLACSILSMFDSMSLVLVCASILVLKVSFQ